MTVMVGFGIVFGCTMISLESFLLILNKKVLHQWNTELRSGFAEPFYKPHQDGQLAEIQFRADSIRSAMHELAHWCVAGQERRKLPDYGYWYRPDGRNAQEQREFFQLEVKPQAIEKAFAQACGVEFAVSADNLNGAQLDTGSFEQEVESQLKHYREAGFSPRVQLILDSLKEANT